MSTGDDWEQPRSRRGWDAGGAGMGALRVALLFGSAAVALALILTPFVARQAERLPGVAGARGLDNMATGSIGQRKDVSYTIRRSVLQGSPDAVCIIHPNGMSTGDC